jgi:iron complex transport system substrate-binding protein
LAAFACASAISFAASGATAAPPARVASLNLCTDELLLLLGAPEQIVSVTHLARDRDESPFWRLAGSYRANDGSVLSVTGLQPDLIVSMGGPARDRERLAARIGADFLQLPFPGSVNDLEASIDRMASALGREAQGRVLIARLERLQASKPQGQIEGLFLTGGGYTQPPGSLGAQWLALAGISTPASIGSRISAELPDLIIRSRYRASQTSRGDDWPGFRFLDRAPRMRVLETDGRLWTCGGPAMMVEIERLREALAR